MTMPVPAGPNRPANVPAPTTGGGYTHRTWLDEMADVLGHVAGVYRDFTVMSATLAHIGAGRTQTALVAHCEKRALELMRAGVQFVDHTDRRYITVFEAIQKAGGQAEVAQDKRYHDRD